MDNPNPDLFIEFISLSGEEICKTSNLKELEHLYYSWTNKFKVKIFHTYDYKNIEEPDIYCTDTQFVFNNIGFNTFPDLIYHILTESTIGAINIVTVIKSSEKIYESKYLYEEDFLDFGTRLYLRRL